MRDPIHFTLITCCVYCIYNSVTIFQTHSPRYQALSGFAERRNLHGMLCVPTTPKSLASNRNWFYRWLQHCWSTLFCNLLPPFYTFFLHFLYLFAINPSHLFTPPHFSRLLAFPQNFLVILTSNHNIFFLSMIFILDRIVKNPFHQSRFVSRVFCTGGINPADPYNPMDNKDHAGMVFLRSVSQTFQVI